jgi:Cellulase (glycosyl hydrolase family 5)
MKTLFALLMVAALLAAPCLHAQNRVHYNNQDLFLSGANLAWSSFANDIGPNPSTPDTNHFADVFNQIHTNGGNSLRLWLHTTGANTPAWSGSTVTGPGNNTIADLQKILDLAWQRKVGVILCLWSFDMLRTNNGATITTRSRNILTNDVYRQAYITNCLIPMVQAVKEHPAIIAWEIFNEPEGMSDEFGWDFNYHVPMSAIQMFINQCGGAIRRTDPKAKVTNGSWSFYATTDAGSGNFNYYTDARLIAAGGDPDGYLDFYTVHYYDWAGTERSPFQHPASYWGLSKPLVVAEFYPDPNVSGTACVNCGSQAYETLYQNGYAGALAWSWTDVAPARILAQIAATFAAHPADVIVISNTAPTLTPIVNQTINPGVTLVLTNVASDPNAPPQTLTFSLLASPANATLNTSNGVFTWRPWVSQASTTNQIKVKVADNGTPSLSATNNFAIAVNPLTPTVLSSISASNGQVSLVANGPPGPDYTLLVSTNLANWQILFTVNSPMTPVTFIHTNLNGYPARFYRIQLGP